MYSEDSISVILNSVQHNKTDNNNNKSFVFCFFVFYFAIFGFICLFQKRMPTNACIIYFSIKRWSDSKIGKI